MGEFNGIIGLSEDEDKTLVVGWIAEYVTIDWNSEIEHEPVAFEYKPFKYKCWGKGLNNENR
ncbi:hypothetical protein [Bacillus toyonensis]|uniref:hypothetical protein n=1 Tax=Bacillus toyonensis TaxID=155322 RepID=UPI00027BEAB9|nr:hypothetical protein [Bacillus toyonensis]EJV41793.1 hypothetical protein IEA_05678 [Bacillus toyonensis]